jgi:hypothetical protein
VQCRRASGLESRCRRRRRAPLATRIHPGHTTTGAEPQPRREHHAKATPAGADPRQGNPDPQRDPADEQHRETMRPVDRSIDGQISTGFICGVDAMIGITALAMLTGAVDRHPRSNHDRRQWCARPDAAPRCGPRHLAAATFSRRRAAGGGRRTARRRAARPLVRAAASGARRPRASAPARSSADARRSSP